MAGFVSVERLTYGPWPAIERMIARLAMHAGFRDVQVVGGAGDMGADVVGTFQGKRWVFQSKYRAWGPVDASAAREAVRSMASYRADVAVAVSCSTFSRDASDYRMEARANGIDLRLWTGAYLVNYFDSLPAASQARKEPRDYQVEAIEAVESARGLGRQSGLVVLATGLGKSLVAGEIIAAEIARNDDQEVLVLAHTRELVRQLESSMWAQLPKGVSTHLWTDGEIPAYPGGVVFATWQSVAAAQARQEPLAGRFGVVVVDEAHHAPAGAFADLLRHLAPNFLLGLTATPWRGDGLRLDELFGEILVSMDIVDGMQKGCLAAVEYRLLSDGIDWDEVALRSREGLTVADLNRLLVVPDRDDALVAMVADELRRMGNARALGFCRSIDHAERMAPMFRQYGVKTDVLHGGLSRAERFRVLTGFRSGKLEMLLSVELLNEGIDVPDANLVVFMRVTHSRRIFIQQLGRGLRMAPGKDKVIVLDFVADIRRLAALESMNRAAKERSASPEVVRYGDGFVHFENQAVESFFDEYLADLARVEDLDEEAVLRFPIP